MISMKELAKLANVDISTVSRAIGDSPRVKPETKELIKKLAKEHGYIPDDLARGLVGKQTHTVGVIIPEFINTFYAEMIDGIESVLSNKGFTMLFGKSSFHFANELQYFNTFLSKRVDGIIACTISNDFLKHLRTMNHSIPLVLSDVYSTDSAFDIVTIDNAFGVQCIIDHLVQLGHTRIGFIGDKIVTKDRFNAYKKALISFGIHVNDAHVKIGTERYELGGYLRMKELLSQDNLPTALFAVTDNMAIGAMHAAFEANLRIPEDISIVGFDDIMVSSYLEIPLTTVIQPKFEIGKYSANLLLSRIDDKNSKFMQQVILKPEMVIRQTTAAARKTE
jgi:DNA-binding LacI/PurR family transcriptional regulator